MRRVLVTLACALVTSTPVRAATTVSDVAPELVVSSSISAPRDSTETPHSSLVHDDRIPLDTSPEVAAHRRELAFTSQCWAVGAPVALMGAGALYGWTASAHADCGTASSPRA